MPLEVGHLPTQIHFIALEWYLVRPGFDGASDQFLVEVRPYSFALPSTIYEKLFE